VISSLNQIELTTELKHKNSGATDKLLFKINMINKKVYKIKYKTNQRMMTKQLIFNTNQSIQPKNFKHYLGLKLSNASSYVSVQSNTCSL
jgi:hypothetical protein